MGKADWRCGSFGEEGGRIHGILGMVREVGRVGIRMLAVKGLAVGVVAELAEQVGTGACTRAGTGRRLAAELGEQRLEVWISLCIAWAVAVVGHGDVCALASARNKSQ